MLFSRISKTCTVLVVALAVLTLLGWISGLSLLASVRAGFIPMAPSTALCFLGISISLLLSNQAPHGVSRWPAIVVLLVAAAKLVDVISGLHFGLDEWLVRNPAAFGGVSTGRMSPITALNFGLLATDAIFLADAHWRKTAGTLGLLVAVVSLTVLTGYLYGTPLLYGGNVVPVALTTALAFLLSAVAAMTMAGPENWPISAFMGGSTRALLLRSFLPVILALALIDGWMRATFLNHSTINPALFSAVGAILFVLLVAAVISSVAGRVGDRIDRAEKALQESEERFRQLSEQSEEVFWFNSLHPERTLYVSPTVKRIWGLSAQGFYQNARAWEESIHPEDRLQVHRAYEGTLAGKDNRFESEYRVLQADGSVRWVHHSGTLIRNKAGEIVRVGGLARDITVRKRIEEEIRRLNEDLESRVAERTAQLTAANQELEAFSYSVSHDLRAPLRHILGFAELLNKNAGPVLDEESLRYLKTISDSVKRMGELINDLLEFSRMARSEMQKVTVHLDDVVKASLQDVDDETKGRNIAWKISPLGEVVGDPSMLRQVMVNLLTNALKFTRTRPQAEIEIGSLPGPGNETIVFVRDNGVGFDMEYANKLFGVFQRLHRQQDFEGTGIGLANVQRIIVRHGGRVWAEAALDHGATFFFSLPVCRSAAVAA